MDIRIAFTPNKIPSHEALATAFLAAAAVVCGQEISPNPTVSRINEDYGERQEETYTYGDAHCGLRAHAVGQMSGHGRHGSRTTWSGLGFTLSGVSQQNALSESFAQLSLDALPESARKKVKKVFYEHLIDESAHAERESDAVIVVNKVVNGWQTGLGWPRADFIQLLRDATAWTEDHSPAGAACRFLLARLLLLDGELEASSRLLDDLSDAGQELAFCRGLACGLAPDGSLWYVYRPTKTPPPRPWMEVQLARGWVAECQGQTEEARRHYASILSIDAKLRGGITPDREAQSQLDRLTAGT